MQLSDIIPSRTTSNFVRSAGALLKSERDARIILVDDAQVAADLQSKQEFESITVVAGKKPFIFSRNMNLGIAAAGNDDVVLLNDDAILETPSGFSLLQQAVKEHPEFGIIAAVTNSVGNLNQLNRGIGLREEIRMACFVCVFIPRSTIEKVGLLDQRYVGYGLDDDDYCLRVRNAGLKIGIHDGCMVDHASLPSTYRGNGQGDYSYNLEIFKQKWGCDNFGRPNPQVVNT